MIKLVDIKKNYNSNKSQVLKGINLSIKEGEALSIMGKSGAGKTTLLNIMGTIDYPSSGDYYYRELKISAKNDKEVASLRNKDFGFVMQDYGIVDYRTVYDNVAIPLLLNKELSNKEMKKRIDEVLKYVGLDLMSKKIAGTLSGGEKQRVAIARALANRPKVIFADEPTGSLDEKNSKKIMSFLMRLNKELGVTLVVITHDYDISAYCDRIVQIVDGKIVGELSDINKEL